MKKLLLLFVTFFACFTLCAQTIFFQDFETSKTAMPAGWHQQLPINVPGNSGWFFTNNLGGYLGFVYIPAHTYFAYVDDVDYNYSSPKLNMDTLYTPVINLSSYSKVFISFDMWFVGLYDTTAKYSEKSNLLVSTNGGSTWAVCDTIYGNTTNYWRTMIFNISKYAGMSNVMFGFTYTDGGYADIGEGIDNIKVYVPPSYDLGVTKDYLPYLCRVSTAYPISGIIHNYGYDTITSMHLNYKVNGGPTVTDNLSSISIKSLKDYDYLHSTSWTPTVTGTTVVKIWADNINGNSDQNTANDTLYSTVIVVDSIQPKEPLMEEFTQASCSPCLYFSPQLDSILDSVKTFCNPIRYHVNWPARDFMNVVTQPVVSQRVTYYGVTGVPTVYMDGEYYFDLSYKGLLKEANLGSPFKITIPTATFNPITNKYNVDVDVKSYATMPAGLTLQVALSVDTMKYQNDQSLAEPQSYFEPPIGVTWGGSPDWLYPYALDYPQVVENMMPSATGTAMSNFTIGQTRTFSFSWVKNHAWADSNKSWIYDSVGTHITVFIQDNSSQYVYQSAIAVPSVALGLNELSDVTTFEIYPNPTRGDATIAFGLKQSQTIDIAVYNLLGEKMETVYSGTMQGGLHRVNINNSDLSSGVYFVNIITDNGTVTRKLIVE